uniref:F-box/LRR-repeat protein 14 n=1 Tax=Mesocestoides corti TaxID=53468 RepID=A0A5K3F1I1_MESCO
MNPTLSGTLIPERMRQTVSGHWRRFKYRDFMLRYLGPPVDPEKLRVAKEFAMKSLLGKCFNTWNHLTKETSGFAGHGTATVAGAFYSAKKLRRSFEVWRRYIGNRKKRIQAFCEIVQLVEQDMLLGTSFKSWKTSVFGETGLTQNAICGEGRDRFAELPEFIQTKCAFVNQAWKVAVDHNAAASELNLSKISRRSDDALLIRLLRLRKAKIRKVCLPNCHLITALGLSALAYCLGVTDIGLRFFEGSQSASSLQYVDVSGCSRFHLQAIGSRAVLEGVECRHRRTPTRLSEIHMQIEGSKNFFDETPRAQNAICEILNKGLKKLCIYGDAELTDLVPERAYPFHEPNSEMLENLTRLAIVNCSKVAFGVESECGRLTNLFYLSIEGCEKLTDEAFAGIRQLRNLRWINFSRTRLSDKTLEYLAGPPWLTHVNLSGCFRVSDRGISRFAAQSLTSRGIELAVYHCQGLREIDLSGVKTVSSLVHLFRINKLHILGDG